MLFFPSLRDQLEVVLGLLLGQVSIHPLLQHAVTALHRLGLDIEPTRDNVGRPPGTFNRTR